MARTRAKAPKKKTKPKKAGASPLPVKKAAPPPEPVQVDRSFQEMRVEAERIAAKRRVASFLERTTNLPWMRQRLGSFEKSIIGGLRNLLAEADRDEAENHCAESYSAHYSVLYGLFAALQHLFFLKATESKLADRAQFFRRAPEPSDLEMVLQELNVFHATSVGDVNQSYFRRELAQDPSSEDALRKRVQAQSRAYDLLNPLKDFPKA